MLYIEYPDTPRWHFFRKLFAVLTYISISTVIIWSYFKHTEYYVYSIYVSEVIFSFLFFLDYFYRLSLSKFSWKFIINPFSIADLLSFLPFFISLIWWFAWYGEVFNIFRLCRVLRIFKVWKYWEFIHQLFQAIKKNLYKYKIAFTLFFIVWIIWSFLVYSVENMKNPMFKHIPDAMRWAIVTMATVWYWDKVPITILGKFLSIFIIIFWPIFLSIITSITIVTFLDVIAYFKKEKEWYEIVCINCMTSTQKESDKYCRICGTKL